MKRLALRALALFCGLILLMALGVWLFLEGSAPRLDGRLPLAGLGQPVIVTRDALGVPVIHAASRADALRVLGFLHAQDRFFQMDLLRRAAAGELAELVGAAALPLDEAHRLFRLRAAARQVAARATPGQRALLAAYTEGVNAGLRDLKTWPFEYGLLMQRPAAWRPEDSVLVIYAMYFTLQDARDRRESDLGVMHDLMPPALYRFLVAPGTQWDAPLLGPAFDTPPIPGPDVIDLHRRAPAAPAWRGAPPAGRDAAVNGSNSFAVSAAHGAGGRALLANDMHLGLAVPNIWYRARIVYPDPANSGRRIALTGVTLPGVPVLVAGSNGHVAWGYTNSYGDWVDLVMLHLKPDDPNYYLTAGGWRAFEWHREIIRVKGRRDVVLNVRDTIWGPVLDRDHDGVERAVHWAAADPAATNLELGALARAENVPQALALAARAGIPAQNFLAADDAGNIGWTIAGRIPLRAGYDPQLPAYWDRPNTGWLGWLPPDQYPRIVNPPEGRLWTANARVVNGASLAAIGDGGYDLGARARQIRDDLMARERFTPTALLGIELDDRAVFLGRWRSLLLRLLTPARVAADPRRAELRRYVENWGGRAAVESVGYRLVRAFRARVEQRVMEPIFAPCRRADPHFDFHRLTQLEGPLWALVSEEPPNLLDSRYKSWDGLLLAAVDDVIGALWRPHTGLATRTWGERNTVRIRHPLSRALPVLGRWLDMRPVELPGDANMPRVQGVDFGASERMVIVPGHERDGFFEMPAGQSDWPLSPFYRNSESAWEQGAPAPFLPGPPRHRLVLQPAD